MKKLIVFLAFLVIPFLSLNALFAEAKNVEIYVTEWCPYCKALEAYLKLNQISYKKFDVEHDSEGMKRYQAMGAGGIPIVVVDGQVMRGFDPKALSRMLNQPNKHPSAEESNFEAL